MSSFTRFDINAEFKNAQISVRWFPCVVCSTFMHSSMNHMFPSTRWYEYDKTMSQYNIKHTTASSNAGVIISFWTNDVALGQLPVFPLTVYVKIRSMFDNWRIDSMSVTARPFALSICTRKKENISMLAISRNKEILSILHSKVWPNVNSRSAVDKFMIS